MSASPALAVPPQPVPRQGLATLGRLLKVLAVMLALLLPVDWFEFTGATLREAGAKPAILVGLLAAGLSLAVLAPLRSAVQQEGWALSHLLAVPYLGTLAFLLNLLLGWSAFNYARSPFGQYLGQMAMLLMFIFCVTGLMRLFARKGLRSTVARALPWVAAVHLGVFLLEAVGVLNDSGGWLVWFRTDGGLIERATGLTSEPSYFGTLAALLGTPLMLIKGPGRLWRVAIAAGLVAAAISISAKTLFVVLFAQIVLLALYGRAVRIVWLMLLLIPLVGGAIWMATVTAATDLSENLSSVMRLGSAATALNAATAGYGLTGIGVGQFHFFYTERFVPDFIYVSEEALAQMDRHVDMRASTFNFFLRLLIETGVIGLGIFLFVVHRALWTAGRASDPSSQLGLLLVAGSLGFLMTQDTYFYPPLAIGLALALTARPKAAAAAAVGRPSA